MSYKAPYVIVTDSTTDLPLAYVEKNDLPVISLIFTMEGISQKDDFGKTFDLRDFYRKMRDGILSTTSQVNPDEFIVFFEPLLQKGLDILYIAFSSALSATYGSAVVAQQELLQKYPQRRLVVIDSKTASMGEGLLVYHALEMKKRGASMDEVIKWLEANLSHVCGWFTVDDLHHLHRGGRLSSTSAFIGSILSIKPILYINDEGKLIPAEKAKGRKQSLKRLIEIMEELIENPNEQVIFISHGDVEEDAHYMEQMIREKFAVKDVIVNLVGPVIGSHAGPGAIALFFMGKRKYL